MSGEKDLTSLLAAMAPSLDPDTYVFVTLPDRQVPRSVVPRMLFEEAEGTTLILRQQQAEALGLNAVFPCRCITLNIHSSLDAVGFIALIATRLAAADMGLNPVAGYFHDHLFVPESRAQDALDLLSDMVHQARNAGFPA